MILEHDGNLWQVSPNYRGMPREREAVHVQHIRTEVGGGTRGTPAEVACTARVARVHEVVIDAIVRHGFAEGRHLQHRDTRAGAGPRLGDIGQRRPARKDVAGGETVGRTIEVDQGDVHMALPLRGRTPAACAGAPDGWRGSVPTACRTCAGGNAMRPSRSGCAWPTRASAGPARSGSGSAGR